MIKPIVSGSDRHIPRTNPDSCGRLCGDLEEALQDGDIPVGTRGAGGDRGPADLAVFQYPTPEGNRPTELAARALLTKQALNRILRHLEHQGYLRLEPLATDHRARVIRLTTRGQDLLTIIKQQHPEIENAWSSQIGRRRFAALRHALIELTAELGRGPDA